MRLLDLQLLAYGPFTDVRLDLSAGKEGLHIIYGPNEAGKSTTLRALGCLLYGFEHKCDDAFLHDQAQLRVGATIRGSDGAELSFVRRKGRKNTLLDSADHPLSEEDLARFLSGTSRELFFSRFGIGFRELRELEAGILAGQGDVGTALASTGFGGVNVRRILDDLDQEAEVLFKPRGQNQRINETISRYVAIRASLKNLSTHFSETLKTEVLISSARKKVEDIRARLEVLNHEKSHLTRLQTAIPKLSRRKDLLNRKTTFSDVVVLANGFSQRRLGTQQSLETARTSLAEGLAELERLQKEVEKLEVPGPILEAKETINEFKQELGAFIKAIKDKPGLLEARSRAQIQAEEIARTISGQPSLQALIKCDLKSSQKQLLTDLAKEPARMAGLRESAEKQITNFSQSLEKICADMASLPAVRDCQGLKTILELITEAGPLEKDREKILGDSEINRSQAEIEAKRLAGWNGTLDELDALSLPDVEKVSSSAKRFQDIEGLITDVIRRKSEAERKQRSIERDLAEILRGGVIPTEEDLEVARMRREQGWNLVRRSWLDGQDISQEALSFDPDHPLPEAYEATVQSADVISDQLRTDARRVARHAALLTDHKDILQELERLEEELKVLKKSLASFCDEWAALWAGTGITPLSPQEMIGWLARIPPIHQRLEQVRSDRLRLGQIEGMIRQFRDGLSRHLAQLGEKEVTETESLREALLRGRRVVSNIEETERKREEYRQRDINLRNDLSTAQKNLRAVEMEQATWESHWREAVVVLDQVVAVTPQSLTEILGQVEEVLHKVDEAEKLSERIRQIDEYARQYQDKAMALSARIAPDLANFPTQQAIQALSHRLEAAQDAKTRLEGLTDQISKTEQSIERQKTFIEELSNQLARLIHEAGCTCEADLPQAEERSRVYLELLRELETIERELIEISPNGDLHELIREAGEIDRDRIEALLASIKDEIESLERESSTCHQEIGRNEQILSAVNGNDEAAQNATQAQMLLAEIHTDAQRYIRLKLAAGILREAVERFRKENQGPLLERAGAIFQAISLGSFSGLETDFGEDDQPILMGVHRDGSRLKVNEMSDGARDQLYLSLRLAHLEDFLNIQREKMPFFVDDILVHFDDQRAVETLKVLAELSARTQILFFTHHHHLLDLAQRALPEGMVFTHRL